MGENLNFLRRDIKTALLSAFLSLNYKKNFVVEKF